MHIRRYFIFCLIILLLFTIGCEPAARFQIQNNTDLTLNVFIAFTALDHVDMRETRIPEGLVEPGKVLKFEDIHQSFLVYLIEAKDSKGNIVYSKQFKREELRKAKWKITINESDLGKVTQP